MAVPLAGSSSKFCLLFPIYVSFRMHAVDFVFGARGFQQEIMDYTTYVGVLPQYTCIVIYVRVTGISLNYLEAPVKGRNLQDYNCSYVRIYIYWVQYFTMLGMWSDSS